MLRIEEIVAKILGVDVNKITDNTGPANSPNWDSLNALMIAAEIEKVFQVNLSIDEITSLKNVGDIKRILQTHVKSANTLHGQILHPIGNNASFHHLGIAISSLAEAKLEKAQAITDPIQKVKIAFAELEGCRIELLEPTGNDSPILNNIKNGVKLLHICFEVDNLESAMENAKKNGFILIAEPVPATAFSKQRIAWLFHRVWGVIELLERAAIS